MLNNSQERHAYWSDFHGPNLGYIQELYDKFLQDPDAVDEDTKQMFAQWGAPTATPDSISRNVQDSAEMMVKAVAAERLVQAIRMYGHHLADLDPLKKPTPSIDPVVLEPAEYGLSEADLTAIPASVIWPDAPADIVNGRDVVNRLRNVYSGTITYQISHVSREEQAWLTRKIESSSIGSSRTPEERISLLRRLLEVEMFEQFLHSTFPGQKRFSVEGLDMLIPMLDHLMTFGMNGGAAYMMIGMAHRGRLNVLAHVLGKPYEHIFAEFQHTAGKEATVPEPTPHDNGMTGDVKYHMGATREVTSEDGAKRIQIHLAHNPSHLEFVNPVVLGHTRAAQEERKRPGAPAQDVTRAFAVLIHGDASFPGEGIVQETLNLSGLKGYSTGGTIHIIANNQIGFTTDSSDARTTKYASDLAKAYEIPVIHVNADDPEACLQAAALAYEYREKFHKDILIDLIGYRRFGHNEMDDPQVTQPILYNLIEQHPRVSERYAERCLSQGWVTASQMKEIEHALRATLRTAYEKVKQTVASHPDNRANSYATSSPDAYVHTGVQLSELQRWNEQLLRWPDSFHPYPKLERILRKRAEVFQANGRVDWAHAETLAFASLLCEGTPIRMTGQDTQRGTFAHRHLILHDVQTGESLVPLQQLPESKASFAIFNSPLTEAAVMGFEYGYDVFAREALVLWEAQYGDFANAAQVIIDTFIAAGRAKWGQRSSLVLLLPHGYEGQGPEHSSARPERFLALAAEHNWTVAYPTSAAQYFHLLRRQAAWSLDAHSRPLIVLTPKGLLRNPRVASPISALCSGAFQPVMERLSVATDQKPGSFTKQIERLILCSGKIAIDLETELESMGRTYEQIGLLRVEQLYPFPAIELKSFLDACPSLKEIVWVQEEPRNIGFWTYMESRLMDLTQHRLPIRYIGRTDRSSPAEGRPDVHKAEQKRILTEALTVNEGVEQR